MASLKDKVTIVTGASSGIGAGIARHFATLGAKLLLTGRNTENLQRVASECEELGLAKENIHQVIADLTTDEGIKSVCSEAVAYFGRIDVLINNAGIVHDITPIEQQDAVTKFNEMLASNVRSPHGLMNQAIPELKKTRGNIVNVSSIISTKPVKYVSAYCASKAALDHLTRCAAIELGGDGIRVNCVNPGFVDTGIHKRAGMVAVYDYFLQVPPKHNVLGRVGTVHDVAKAVAFIASDDASFITGTALVVDGGESLI